MKLFNWFKKEGWGGTRSDQAIGGTNTQENVMKASIGFDNTTQKFTLSAGGTTVGTYARARDARRGAARRGFTVIS